MPHRLTLAQFSVLNHFSRLGGEKNIGRLAKAFQVSKATMSGVVANLERKGYVTVRPDPSDRRGKLAGLSPGGLAARNDAIAALLPGLKKIEASFGAARLKSMLPGLSALREHLDKNR